MLAKPLSQLFQQSIRESKLPKLWKIASVCQGQKPATPSVNDIRPINVLPVPTKLLDRLIVDALKSKFLKIFGSQQFGYGLISSTQCALISVQEHSTLYLDDPTTLGAMLVTYDYTKEVDRLRSDMIVA